MRHAYALALGGALFKKKVKENGHDGNGSRAHEKAIRDKVVDELRAREDTLREREAALAAREDEHGKKSAELALKLQELAVRESELKGKYADGSAPAGPAGHHRLPPDSDNIEEQEKLVKALEQRLASARARHDGLRRAAGGRGRLADTISAYSSSGYVVARLEKLKNLPAAELEKALGQFEKDAAALGPLAARCDALDRAVAKQAAILRARCNDPDAIPDIERGIRELEANVEARRSELRNRLDRWRGEGYAMARLDKVRDSGLVALEEAAAKFEDDLEVLRLFREKLDTMDASARKGAARLVPLLKDPDNIPALEKEFQALEKQAGTRVQQFIELFEKWRSEGFRVETLEKALAADEPTMRAAFLKYEEDLSRLRALSERASRLDVSFATQVAGLNRGLHDPEQLHQMELAVKELEDEAEKHKAAPARRAHTPPPKVVAEKAVLPPKMVATEKAAPPATEGRPGRERAEARLGPEDQRVFSGAEDLGQSHRSSAPPAPKAHVEQPAKPAPKAPPEERPLPAPPAPPKTPAEPTKAPAGPALAAGSPEAEFATEMLAAETLIKELEAKKIDSAAAANMLKLGKSFARSRNYAKALQYAKKARDTAAAMKK